MRRTIWISAGEVSGDMHGASLMAGFRRLGANLTFTGMGGSAMVAQGFEARFDAHAVAVMGVVEVLAHVPRLAGVLLRTWQALKAARPAAVVLIDIPDFNFLVARMAAALGIPVYFYVSPQVWAWRTGRVKFLSRVARKILCILPFEVDFYAAHGVRAEFVGHPLLDVMDLPALDAVAAEPLRLGLLPGSRKREVATLLPAFGETARRLAEELPGLRVCLLRAPGMDPEELRALLPDPGVLPVEHFGPEDRYAQMRRCQMLLAASGTVTLEAALLGVPTAVSYVLNPLTYALAKRLIDVPFISLPNLILGRGVFPEFIQERATADELLPQARQWLTDPQARARTLAELAELRRLVGGPGAAGRAAASILEDLGV